MFSIGSNSYNIKQSIVSNVAGIENKDEYKYSYARVLFDETEGMNFDIAANREVFVEDVLNYIYGKVPTEAGAYDAIIATGYSTVVLDKPLTEHDMELAEKRFDDPEYVFSDEEVKSCADTDRDGLFDFEEVMFFNKKLFKHKLITHENNEIKLPSVDKVINNLDEIAYVQSGREKAKEQYGDSYDEFLNFSVLPIISDPTNEDSDNDNLPDVCEHYIKSKGLHADTDHDGISDSVEYFFNTSPIKNDTDNNGVADSEEDYDNDGISNIEEYINGTYEFSFSEIISSASIIPDIIYESIYLTGFNTKRHASLDLFSNGMNSNHYYSIKTEKDFINENINYQSDYYVSWLSQTEIKDILKSYEIPLYVKCAIDDFFEVFGEVDGGLIDLDKIKKVIWCIDQLGLQDKILYMDSYNYLYALSNLNDSIDLPYVYQLDINKITKNGITNNYRSYYI